MRNMPSRNDDQMKTFDIIGKGFLPKLDLISCHHSTAQPPSSESWHINSKVCKESWAQWNVGDRATNCSAMSKTPRRPDLSGFEFQDSLCTSKTIFVCKRYTAIDIGDVEDEWKVRLKGIRWSVSCARVAGEEILITSSHSSIPKSSVRNCAIVVVYSNGK